MSIKQNFLLTEKLSNFVHFLGHPLCVSIVIQIYEISPGFWSHFVGVDLFEDLKTFDGHWDAFPRFYRPILIVGRCPISTIIIVSSLSHCVHNRVERSWCF